jgi:hypothetical protein
MYIGYRAWNLRFIENDIYLSSLAADFDWLGPVVESGAKPVSFKDESFDVLSYSHHSEYGIFSFKNYSTLKEAFEFEDLNGGIKGIIQPFGLVRIHEDGYRSEKAQVLAICDNIGCCFVNYVSDDLEPEYCTAKAIITNGIHTFCGDHRSRFKELDQYLFKKRGAIPLDDILQKLSVRYGCEIIGEDKMENFKEEYYGTW